MNPATATIHNGQEDIRRAAEDLADRLPAELAPLAQLAYNYRWSWTVDGPELFRSLDPARFEVCAQNPLRLLTETSTRTLRRAANDPGFLERLSTLESRVTTELSRPPEHPIPPHITAERPVAFFCAEYGIHVSLPIYSGGLGALAGDLLKEASDRGIPFVAVGLMYRKGYFRQRVDAGGLQHEYWVDTDPERLPAALVTGPSEEPLTISVPIYQREVTAQIWRVDVGRVPLFLLDTDLPENSPVDRWVTARLYEADPDTRLAQYILLGVGGVRALRAVGVDPAVVHLNEGHAALAPLELAGAGLAAGEPLQLALAAARARTVFTTHTPVPAGNDSYPPQQIEHAIAQLTKDMSIPETEVVGVGQSHPDDPAERFGVTQAALRMSRAANAVSRRHGEVAREMWSTLWPDRPIDEVPIGHVTNGVHVPTWIGTPMRALLDRVLGEGWISRADDPQTWARIDQVSDEELWAVRQQQRAEMVSFIKERSTGERLARGDLRDYVEAVAQGFDADVLTLGFARRVATYKRLDLLTRDPDWTMSLLGGEQRVQVVLAGKAHPRDDEAKAVLQRLFGLKWARIVGERVAYLDDYDLSTAAQLVRGCDVWLNVPRPPLEASGTSGMKSAFNGGLQLSVLDGWWAEAYDGENGWALSGDVEPNHALQDDHDVESLHKLLSDDVLPAFYERDEDGLPRAWLARIRASLRSLGPRFCASRMLQEYIHGPYRE